MTRGETSQTKVHYKSDKGDGEDFIIFIDDPELFKKWQSDKSVPLAHFISRFQVFVTHKQGAQGTYDSASKSTLSAHFDTENVDDVIQQILVKGTSQVMEMPARQGITNETKGGMLAH
ncbi:hypothetical protein S40285_00794 [Stachybotrys chlorohalonatus IBT 40285]|uniref:Ribosome maturation protein SDO1/SBDS N-terminal domain-containing protein n=1 Tax=Stachybotrys chlorohalonatus (strain IBT 40285) TaxID=1283841 RepID=A0A084QJR3_STAC4|nr:hypothetical protein S40285_00794 [Stachybotrys chlorohalonata IBT 40285]